METSKLSGDFLDLVNNYSPPSEGISQWDRVEVFRLVYGKLPSGGDAITQSTLNEFCRRFDAGEISSHTTDLRRMYALIQSGSFPLLVPAETQKKIEMVAKLVAFPSKKRS